MPSVSTAEVFFHTLIDFDADIVYGHYRQPFTLRGFLWAAFGNLKIRYGKAVGGSSIRGIRSEKRSASPWPK